MRFKFKLLLSTLVFLSACQTRLSFEGRRYTKGVYYNVSHGKTKYHNKFLKLNTKPAEATFVYATQDIKPQTSLVKNPEVLKHNTQQPKQALKAETVFNDNKSSKMHFNTKAKSNTQSKWFKNSKNKIVLKPVLTLDEGWEIFKIVLLSILGFLNGIAILVLIVFLIANEDALWLLLVIPSFIVFVFLWRNIFKRIKNFYTTVASTIKSPKNNTTKTLIKPEIIQSNSWKFFKIIILCIINIYLMIVILSLIDSFLGTLLLLGSFNYLCNNIFNRVKTPVKPDIIQSKESVIFKIVLLSLLSILISIFIFGLAIVIYTNSFNPFLIFAEIVSFAFLLYLIFNIFKIKKNIM